jgi:GxxExxY protein
VSHRGTQNTEEPEAVEQVTNDWADRIIGAAIEVHRLLGPGFLESIYENALCRELRIRGVPFKRQARVPVFYKDELVGEGRLDLMVANLVVVELKAAENIQPIHYSQLLSYLKATGLKLGLLINFKERRLMLGIRRVIRFF